MCGQRICTNICWTWASYVTITSIRININTNSINSYLLIFLAPEGIEPSYVMMKTLCLNHLTIRPYIYIVVICYNTKLMERIVVFYNVSRSWLDYVNYTALNSDSVMSDYSFLIKSSASIALASAGYKTATLLLC